MLDDIKIMQFADGTLDASEKEAVQKEIENNAQYKKILENYIYTGEILANISKEIKSKPLPEYLNNKIIQFNKSQIQIKANNKLSFNFFNIFNIKYSAIAAAFGLFFVSGFFTNQFLINQNPNYQIAQKDNKFYDPIFRGSSSFINFYESFNERKFNEEINTIANKLKKEQKFEILISDDLKAKFQYTESFKNKNNNECIVIKSDKKIKLTSGGSENIISLTVCKNNNYWSLTNINIF